MRFHDLRHTAVTRMLRARIPLTTVAAIVGWSSATMYLMAKRYAHILQPEMREAVAVLEGTVPSNGSAAGRSSRAQSAVVLPSASRYNREELYEKVWELPLKVLAKEYDVSDVALTKACKRLRVPLPGLGYWAKKSAGKPVPERPPLPEFSMTIAEGEKKPVQSEKPESNSVTAVAEGD